MVMNKDYKIKRGIKVYFLRFLRKIKPYNRYTYPERLLRKNIIKLISQSGNRMHVTSDSKNLRKAYIQSKDKSYNIVFSEDYMKFTNHEFFFKEPINSRLGRELLELTSQYLDKFYLETENEIFKNESSGLVEILNKLNS
jgi:hypothetical protein